MKHAIRGYVGTAVGGAPPIEKLLHEMNQVRVTSFVLLFSGTFLGRDGSLLLPPGINPGHIVGWML